MDRREELEYEPFISNIERFLIDSTRQEEKHNEIEGRVVTDREFKYRLQVSLNVHSYRISVDIVRDRFSSFLDDEFMYYHLLYSKRVLRNLLEN